MRNTSRVAVSLVALAWSAGAAAAQVQFTATAVNLGELRSGARVAHAFEFVNRSQAPAELVEARPGCGCLRPKLVKLTFLPGERGAVPVDVNVRGQSAGPHTWKMSLRFRAGGREQDVTLEVSAKVVTEVTVQPAALTLVSERPLTQEILITDLRAKPLALREFVTSSPRLRARLVQHQRDGLGHWVWRVALEVGDGWPEGSHGERLMIYTDDPDYREIEVPITLVRRPRPRITSSPERLGMELAAGQARLTRTVRLRDRDGAALAIEAATADHPALRCEVVDGAAQVRVTLDRAKMESADLESAVRVRLSGPVRETVVIPVTCLVE